MELLGGTVPTPDSAQAIQALGLAWVGGAPLPVDRTGAGVVRSEQMPARNDVFGYNLSSHVSPSTPGAVAAPAHRSVVP
jgi:hypothetical protein